MKILVTGHMGLLGRHLARSLKGKGHEVHGCDIKGGTDCRETFKINDLKYDFVLHCARPALPAQKMGVDADFFDWADRTQPARAAYFSSDLVYPLALQGEPYRLNESDAAPDSPDGWVYLTAEKMALDRGFNVFRPFNVYGEKGTGVVEQLISMARDRPEPFRSPACGQVLDFIHVDDVAAAALEVIEGDDLQAPLNLCTGEPTAVDGLAEMIFALLKWKPKQLLCDPYEEQFFRCGDPTAMNELRPAAISLLDGIRKEL